MHCSLESKQSQIYGKYPVLHLPRLLCRNYLHVESNFHNELIPVGVTRGTFECHSVDNKGWLMVYTYNAREDLNQSTRWFARGNKLMSHLIWILRFALSTLILQNVIQNNIHMTFLTSYCDITNLTEFTNSVYLLKLREVQLQDWFTLVDMNIWSYVRSLMSNVEESWYGTKKI